MNDSERTWFPTNRGMTTKTRGGATPLVRSVIYSGFIPEAPFFSSKLFEIENESAFYGFIACLVSQGRFPLPSVPFSSVAGILRAYLAKISWKGKSTTMTSRRPELIGVVLAYLVVGCDQTPNSMPTKTVHSSQQTATTTPASQTSVGGVVSTMPATAEPIRADLQTIARLIASDRTGPARVQLVNYLKTHPGDSQATFLFGLSYHREKKYGEAVDHFRQAIAAPNPYCTTNHFLGWATFYLGELEEARAAFLQFLLCQPDEPDSHYALGLMALDAGDLHEAAGLFNRCHDLAEHDPRQARMKLLSKSRYGLGRVHEQNGDYLQAKQEFAQSVELFPDHYEALYRLNRALVKLGEHEQAAEVHERYLQTKERVRPGTSFPE